MRRKVQAMGSGIPEDLLYSSLPAYADDHRAPYRARKAAWEDWMEGRRRIQVKRRLYAAQHGWPGGWDAMEGEAPPIPDSPFRAKEVLRRPVG